MLEMISKVYLDKDGIELFIGHLQAAVLRVLWDHDQPMTVSQIRTCLRDQGHDFNIGTVWNTVRKLTHRKLVLRVGEIVIPSSTNQTAAIYRPAHSTEEAFRRECTMIVLRRLNDEALI